MKTAAPLLAAAIAVSGLAAACTPTVQVAAPSEPIRIDLNVKIDQEIRVRLDEDVEALISENPDIF